VRAVVGGFRVVWFAWLMILMICCIYTQHGHTEYISDTSADFARLMWIPNQKLVRLQSGRLQGAGQA